MSEPTTPAPPTGADETLEAMTPEQEIVTHCVNHMWAVMTERYSAEAIEQMRWAMSVDTLRTIVASVLNAVEQLPYRIVKATAVPDAEVIQSILDLLMFADDCDVDDTTINAQKLVRRYLENLPEEMQP